MRRFLVNLFAVLFLLSMTVNPVLATKTPPPHEFRSYDVGVQSLDLLAPSNSFIVEIGNEQVALTGDTFTQFTVDTSCLQLIQLSIPIH